MSRATKSQRNYENVNKGLFPCSGYYEIPVIQPVAYRPCDWIGFNYAAATKQREGKGIHFFLDDYQFTRLWTNVDYYIPLLTEYECVMSPDFSLYIDFPKALQIYNHYRKHWLAAYMQMNGIQVVPTIGWSTSDSFDWCFEGEPVGGTVAVSSIGTNKTKASAALFREGYQEMMNRLRPDTILFYGKIPEGCGGNIVPIGTFQEKYKGLKRNK